jgi:hypothetical protein
MYSKNPIVKRVKSRFTTIQKIAEVFVTSDSPQRGLLISGDAGTGKSHYIKQAFINTNTTNRVDYRKSTSFTAPALYAALWENRNKGDVIVFDDCSLESMPTADFRKWTDWIKGGLEITSGERMIGYQSAKKNKLFEDLGVESEMDFQGSIVWITNSRFDKLEKKFGDSWDAISTRFRPLSVFLTKEEKYMYTCHLIEDLDMLGKECDAKEGGYPQEVIDKTVEFLSDKYDDFKEITPRIAIVIADTIYTYGNDWEMIIDNMNVYG